MPATFPSTSVLDNFNRADGALGSNWTSPFISTHSTPTIFTNAMVGVSGADNSSYWNASTFGAISCEAFVTVPAAASGAIRGTVFNRGANFGTGTFCCYQLDCRFDNNTIDLYRFYNNASSASLLSRSQPLDPAMRTGLRSTIVGGDIHVEAWVYVDATTQWVCYGTYVDVGAVATYPSLAAAGYIGCQLYGEGNSLTRCLDDFGGGNSVLSYTPTAWWKA